MSKRWEIIFADQFPEKMIRANVIPAIERTREFGNPVFSALPLPSILNRLTYTLSDLGLSMMMNPVKKFRRSAGLPLQFKKTMIPSLYGISEYFLPKPKDYPASTHFKGFWTTSSTTALSNDITEFLQNGPPPLLFTFGSITFDTELDLPNVINSITNALNIRVIVVKGWGLNDTEKLANNPNIKVVAYAPYDKLLPFVKAVVHHGGIGTITASLLAAKPFLTCPVLYPLGDQHFWGTIAYSKGVALKPVPLKKMTEKLMIANVKKLISTESLYANIQELSKKLQNEHGIEKTIELIENS